MKFALRSLLSFALCVALLAPIVNCAHQTQAQTTDESVVDALARSGIAVYDSFTSRIPLRPVAGKASAIRLTRWQVSNLASEVAARHGYLGAQFDTLARMPKSAPPFSYFVASWILHAHSAGAGYARQLMGKQDWKHAPRVIFPLLVLVLFVADATRQAAPMAKAPPDRSLGIAPFLGAPAEAAAPCSAVTGFVSSVINAVFNALQVSSSAFWASLWNGVLELVKGVVFVVIGATLTPLVNILTTAATAIATISLITSALQPWTATIRATPGVNRFGIAPGSGLPGDLAVMLAANQINWPPEVVDCAKSVGVDLNQITFVNSPVAWNQIIGIPQLATQQSRDNQIRPDKTATLHYLTRVEPPPPACAVEVSGVITVNVTVIRNDITRLFNMLQHQVLLSVPAKLRDVIEPILESKSASVREALLSFKNPSAVGSALILHHETPPNCNPQNPNPPQPPQPPQPKPPQPHRVLSCDALITPDELSSATGRSGVEVMATGPVCHFAGAAVEPQAAAAGLHGEIGHIAVWDSRFNAVPQAISNLAAGMGLPPAGTIDGLWARAPAARCLRAGVTCFTSADHSLNGIPAPGGVLYLHVPGTIIEIYYPNHDTHKPDIDVENRIAAFIARRL